MERRRAYVDKKYLRVAAERAEDGGMGMRSFARVIFSGSTISPSSSASDAANPSPRDP